MKRKQDDTVKHLAGARRVGELQAARAIGNPAQRRIALTRLVRSWIDRDLLQQEAALQAMAWMEYRYQSALDRTEAFAKVYFDTYRKIYAEHFSEEDAAKKQPIERDLIRNDLGVMNALWSARMRADSLGMPYDFYLDKIMREHVVKDRWKHPPRPNQLYGKLSGPRMRDAMDREQISARLYGADWDERFKVPAYTGDPVQEAALVLLQDIVNNADDPAVTLADYLCERQVIAWERAEELFGAELVEAAMDRSDNPANSGPSVGPRYIPACLGMPDPSEDAPCASCSVSAECIQFTLRVKQELIEVMGTDDPRGGMGTQGKCHTPTASSQEAQGRLGTDSTHDAGRMGAARRQDKVTRLEPTSCLECAWAGRFRLTRAA